MVILSQSRSNWDHVKRLCSGPLGISRDPEGVLPFKPNDYTLTVFICRSSKALKERKTEKWSSINSATQSRLTVFAFARGLFRSWSASGSSFMAVTFQVLQVRSIEYDTLSSILKIKIRHFDGQLARIAEEKRRDWDWSPSGVILNGLCREALPKCGTVNSKC